MKIEINFILSAKAKRKEIVKLESSKTSTKLDFAKEGNRRFLMKLKGSLNKRKKKPLKRNF